VLARELTLKEITTIHKEVPEMELEVFAHGSMCISYSGRCLLSNYMTGRHANLGDCAQPCRWNYKIEARSKKNEAGFFLEEKERPGEYFEIEETENGTNIMSSKDLSTVEYIDKMIKAGITGFKIEGRNKTEYYLAATALAYREAIDLSLLGKYVTADRKRLNKELEKIAHRDYTSGFLFDEAKAGETYQGRSPIENWRYVAQIISSPAISSATDKSPKKIKKRSLYSSTDSIETTKYNYKIIVKNKIKNGMNIEVLTPEGIKKDNVIEIIIDKEVVNEISPGKEDQRAIIKLQENHPSNSFIRALK
jgi:U32 family peptidase